MSDTSVETEHQKKNRIIKECLSDPQKRRHLNHSMAMTIRSEIYGESLARVLLLPRLIKDGRSPVFSETENGPVVVVNVVQTEKRVLHCRAYRDSLREEEDIKIVRDIDFVVMRGQGVRPASFPISNVCTVRLPELNGHAYSLVERARSRMKTALAIDETKVVLKALAWVCSRFARLLWKSRAEVVAGLLISAVERIGAEKNPIILCNPMTMVNMSELRFLGLPVTPETVPTTPIKALKVGTRNYPVYSDLSIPEHMIYVIPSGESLGEMPIFRAPDIIDYDKPERLIIGWLCYQDQGIVFINPKLMTVIYLGTRGFLEMIKSFLKRIFR